MSDPMTNIEIEDVLSSIRRLVSEETRVPTRFGEPRPMPQTSSDRAVADKLVLTPALRVVPKAEPEEPEPDLPPPGPSAALVAEVLEAAITHEAAAAAVEATLAVRPEQWEPDGSEMPPTEWAVDWSAEGEPPFASVRGQAAAEADAASLSPASAEGPAIPPAWPSYEPFFDEAADQGISDPDAPKPDNGIDAGGKEEGQVEPSPTDTAQYPKRDLDDLLDDPAPDYIDAEALRDMIRDILREELQGPLGERITRNVRKLVRAEINRALSTRDFD